MEHRHGIAVCDLSLIKWDQVRIIFTRPRMQLRRRIFNCLRTNWLTSLSIMAIDLPFLSLQMARGPRRQA